MVIGGTPSIGSRPPDRVANVSRRTRTGRPDGFCTAMRSFTRRRWLAPEAKTQRGATAGTPVDAPVPVLVNGSVVTTSRSTTTPTPPRLVTTVA